MLDIFKNFRNLHGNGILEPHIEKVTSKANFLFSNF